MSDPLPHEPKSRLDQISTRASLLAAAHGPADEGTVPARQALVMRYRRAIRGYLGALLRNPQDADEVAQDLLVKLLQGGFAGADAERGRFRDYVKGAVRNAAMSFLRKRQRGEALDSHELQLSAEEESPDATWQAECRRSLLDAALARLAAFEARTPGNLGATLCRLLAEHPDEDSEQLAGRVEQQTGRPLRADAVRKQISRARRKLAEFLVEEVRLTLAEATPTAIDEELGELGLRAYAVGFGATDDPSSS